MKSYSSISSIKRRVVVTGIGVISPIGIGENEFWGNCLRGKSGVSEIDQFSTDQFESKIAGTIRNFNPENYGINKLRADTLDRYIHFAIAASKMAMEDSGLNLYSYDHNRTGVSIATAIGGTPFMEKEFLALTNAGYKSLDPRRCHKSLYKSTTFNTASTEVATDYCVYGPCFTLSTGCTGGIDAIGASFDCIRYGYSDIMITGASEAPLTPIAMAAFDVIGTLSTKRNNAPQTASRPYDKDRDGFVLAEGCGILILEELNHAIKREAKILCEIKGFGSTSNAFHMTDLPPDGKDLLRGLKIAIDDAGISSDDIDYINSHGSSTLQNDINETSAFKQLLGKGAYDVPISSQKSMNGHPLAAANAIEIIATILTLKHKIIPPTINYEYPDPLCDLNYVPNKAMEHNVRIALKNASGFSGIHSAIILSDLNGIR